MAEATIQLGGGNWAGKTDNLLGYYKEGERFYKQDFTFSRSTTGTYTDSDGYIQEMPYNLLQQSNQFDTTWTKDNTTLTSGQSGYDGSSDAWKLTKSSNQYAKLIQAVSISDEVTYSFYIKADSLNYAIIYIDASTDVAIWVDLTNGTITNTLRDDLVTNKQVESLQNGWYRCSISTNQVVSHIRIFPNDTSTTYGITSGSIYIQDAQLNKGTSAKTYFPTTTRLNIPRVDYLNNSNGSLILEPQRTNIATYSSDYTQSFYIKDSGITATLNQSTSPTGLNDAAKISVTNSGRIYANHTTGTYATSVFIKAGTFSNFKVQGQNVDLGVTPIVTGSLDSEDYGNGWYRLTGYYTGTRSFQVQAYPDNTYSSHTDSGDYYLFGTQIEAGSYPTSLIPTTGTTVTRLADASATTGLSDVIGQTQGTLYSEFDLTEDVNSTLVEINLGNSTNNRILAYRSLSYIQFVVQVGGVIQINNATLVNFANTNKIAVTYQTNDFKIYLNGSLVKTYVSGNIPSGFNTIPLQDNFLQGRKQGIKSLAIFKEILTSTELETLTTL